MPQEMGIEDARRGLGGLVRGAANDGTVTLISSHGVVAAAIVPLRLLPATEQASGDLGRYQAAVRALVDAARQVDQIVALVADVARQHAEARHPELTRSMEDPEQQAVILADPEYAAWLDHVGHVRGLRQQVEAVAQRVPALSRGGGDAASSPP